MNVISKIFSKKIYFQYIHSRVLINNTLLLRIIFWLYTELRIIYDQILNRINSEIISHSYSFNKYLIHFIELFTFQNIYLQPQDFEDTLTASLHIFLIHFHFLS